MSINIDQFDERSSEELTELGNPERVLRFLYDHRDRAWKAREIARRTDVHANSIHPVLSRLEERGLVRHKGPYWAITDDRDRLQQAEAFRKATRLFDELYGEEDRSQWVQPETDDPP